MSEQGKAPSESAIEQSVYKVFPNDLNSNGDDGKPHSVPPVLPQTKAEIRRFEAAGTRREQRLRNKANRRYA